VQSILERFYRVTVDMLFSSSTDDQCMQNLTTKPQAMSWLSMSSHLFVSFIMLHWNVTFPTHKLYNQLSDLQQSMGTEWIIGCYCVYTKM